MKYERKLMIRVAAAIILMVIPINIFAILLQKPTMYLSYIPLKVIGYDMAISGELITIAGHTLRFIPACTATSAYYLLAILILLTKDISLKKAAKMFLTGVGLILLMNIVRIDILLIVLVNGGVNLFESLHIFFWEFVSSIYVAAVWIFLIKKFRVKSIPVISDIKELYKKAKR